MSTHFKEILGLPWWVWVVIFCVAAAGCDKSCPETVSYTQRGLHALERTQKRLLKYCRYKNNYRCISTLRAQIRLVGYMRDALYGGEMHLVVKAIKFVRRMGISYEVLRGAMPGLGFDLASETVRRLIKAIKTMRGTCSKD